MPFRNPNSGSFASRQTTGYREWSFNIEYGFYAEQVWPMVRDCVRGHASVINEEKNYLITPQLNIQGEVGVEPSEYSKFARLGSYTNFPATAKSLAMGVLFNEPHTFNVKAEYNEVSPLDAFKKSIERNADIAGNSLKNFMSSSIGDEFETGSSGILTEMLPLKNMKDLTQSGLDQIRDKLTFFRHFNAEQIEDWNITQMDFADLPDAKHLADLISRNSNRFDNMLKEKQDLIVLRITHQNRVPSGSIRKLITRYLFLGLDENGDYYQEVYESGVDYAYGGLQGALDLVRNERTPYYFRGTTNTQNLQLRVGKRIYPMVNGERLNYIPFSRFNGTFRPQEPFLNEICHKSLKFMNKETQRDYVDYKNALAFEVFYGVSKDDVKKQGWQRGNPMFVDNAGDNTRVEVVEHNGVNIENYNETLKQIQSEIATISILPLTPDTRNVETAEAHAIKNSSRNNMLATISNIASNVMQEHLKQAALMRGYDQELVEEIEFNLNPDYTVNNEEMTVEQLVSLSNSGLMSKETAIKVMAEQDMLPEGTDEAEELAKIQKASDENQMRAMELATKQSFGDNSDDNKKKEEDK